MVPQDCEGINFVVHYGPIGLEIGSREAQVASL